MSSAKKEEMEDPGKRRNRLSNPLYQMSPITTSFYPHDTRFYPHVV